MRARRVGWGAVALTVAVALAALLTLLSVEGPTDFAHDLSHVATEAVVRLGPGASLLALYAEESGLPLPVPGDLLVVYIGHHFASSFPALVGAWCALEVAVVGGATNLYLLARHFGRRLLQGWVGAILHLTPARLERVEHWSRRWGPLVIIFGRHIFGLRPAVTIASGLIRVPYPIFAVCTAISAAPWAAVLLWIGVRYGYRLGHFLHLHGWAYAVIPMLVVVGLVVAIVRGRRTQPDARRIEQAQSHPAGAVTSEGASGADGGDDLSHL